jgi:archaemetzincin
VKGKSLFLLIIIVLLFFVGFKIYDQPALVYSLSQKDTYKVLFIPYNMVSEKDKAIIKEALESFYKVEVTVNESLDLPKETFIQVKSPRYRADKLIKWQKTKAKNYDFVIGFTNSDISTSKRNDLGLIKEPKSKYEDWGIMGLAYCPGKSCIVSSFRIKHNNRKIFEDRLKKVVVHEFGHNLGLKHCPNKLCLMTDAVETVNTIDHAKFELCEDCKSQIKIKLKSN